jgi:phosphate-selective porin OprO/OprP
MERIMKLKKFAALGSAALIATAAAWPARADMTVNVGGRIQVDAAIYDDDETDLGDGTEFRRARFFMDGNIDDSWKYKLQIDFADNDLDMKDAYIQHSSGIKIGQFKKPFSLDALTSSKYGTFMERAMVIDAFLVQAPANSRDERLRAWVAPHGAFGQVGRQRHFGGQTGRDHLP